MPEGAKVLVTLDVEADKFINQMGQANKLIENAVKALKQYERMTVAMSIMKQFEKSSQGAMSTQEAMDKTRATMTDISRLETTLMSMDESQLSTDKDRRSFLKARMALLQKERSILDAQRALTTDQTRMQWTVFIAATQTMKAVQSIWTSTKAWGEWTAEIADLYNSIFEPMMSALYPLLDALAPVFEAIGNFFDALGPAAAPVAAILLGFMWLGPTLIKIIAYMKVWGKTAERITLSNKKLNLVQGKQAETYNQVANMNARNVEGINEVLKLTKNVKKATDEVGQAGAAAAAATTAAAATGAAPAAAAAAAAPPAGVPPEIARIVSAGGGGGVGTFRGRGRKAKTPEEAIEKARRVGVNLAGPPPKIPMIPKVSDLQKLQGAFDAARTAMRRFDDDLGLTQPTMEEVGKLAARMRMNIAQASGAAADAFAASATGATSLDDVTKALNKTSMEYTAKLNKEINAQKGVEEGISPHCLVSAFNEFAESQKVVIVGAGKVSKEFLAQKRVWKGVTKNTEEQSSAIVKSAEGQRLAVNSATLAVQEDASGMKDAKKSGKGFMKTMKGGVGTVGKMAIGFGVMGVVMALLGPLMEVLQPIFEVLGDIFEAILVPLQPFIDLLVQAVENVLPIITFWIQKLQEFLAPLALAFQAWVESLPPEFVQGVLGFLAIVITAICTPLKFLWDLVVAIATAFINWAKESGFLQGILEGLKGLLIFLKPLFDFIAFIFKAIATGAGLVAQFVFSVATAFGAAVKEGGILYGVFKVIGIIMQAIGLGMQFFFNIINVIIGAVKALGGIFGVIFKGILFVFAIVYNAIAMAIEFITNIIIGIINALLIPVNIFRAFALLPPIIIPFIVIPKIPILETGGFITKGGLFELHPGERVIPAGEPAGPITNNFEIHATIRSEADIYDLARRISEMQEDRYSRNRVAYAGR